MVQVAEGKADGVWGGADFELVVLGVVGADGALAGELIGEIEAECGVFVGEVGEGGPPDGVWWAVEEDVPGGSGVGGSGEVEVGQGRGIFGAVVVFEGGEGEGGGAFGGVGDDRDAHGAGIVEEVVAGAVGTGFEGGEGGEVSEIGGSEE